MEIRIADGNDLADILKLYTQLTDHGHDSPMPEIDGRVRAVWQRIRSAEGHFIIVGVVDGCIVSSCVLIVVQNLTHNQRPYALIENVVTDERHRNKGYASAVLNHAKAVAQQANCYKMMLMTGSKQEGTLLFYERAGYNSQDKTAFVQWIE